MQKNGEYLSSTQTLADLLTRHVGCGKSVSVEDVAQRADCSIGSVYAAQNGRVGHDLAMRLLLCLPDEAVTEYFSFLGLSGVRRTEAEPGCYHQTHYEIARTGKAYADFLRDGLLDHRERKELSTKFLPRLLAAAARCVRAGA
jgi:hypothetical protein